MVRSRTALALLLAITCIGSSWVDTSLAQGTDREQHTNAWLSLGVGAGIAEGRDGSGLAAHAGLTVSRSHAVITARLLTQGESSFDGAYEHEAGFLVGTSFDLDRALILPAVGIARVWGRDEGSTLDRGEDWGSRTAFAYELQFLWRRWPWIGATLYGNVNDTKNIVGATVAVRMGWLPSRLSR